MAVLQDIYTYFNTYSNKAASLIYNPILISS